MAPKPVKFFTWISLERILVAVAREPAETVDEYLSWLRTIHLISLSIISVFRASSNLLNISPRSPLGETAYKTFTESAVAFNSAVGMFPQEEAKRLLEILEEVALPLPAPD